MQFILLLNGCIAFYKDVFGSMHERNPMKSYATLLWLAQCGQYWLQGYTLVKDLVKLRKSKRILQLILNSQLVVIS